MTIFDSVSDFFEETGNAIFETTVKPVYDTVIKPVGNRIGSIFNKTADLAEGTIDRFGQVEQGFVTLLGSPSTILLIVGGAIVLMVLVRK